MRRRSAHPLAAVLGLACSTVVPCALALASPGCGDVGEQPGDAGGGDGAKTVVLHPDAPPLPGESECVVVEVTNIPVAGAIHVKDCAPVEYETNPPSGGNHWPFWAAFKKYSTPVPREMYVHDLEHGGVVLSFKCDDACPDVVAALGKVADQMADPLCLKAPGGPAARVLVTPDPLLDTPIAVSAWGATYTATCIDEASLSAFVSAVYGHGTESLCADGKDIESGFVPCGKPMLDAGDDASDDGG